MIILTILIKPSLSALGQPLRMAAHLSDWGGSLKPHRRDGKRLSMVEMFVSCLMLMLGDDPNTIVLFLLYETYRVGVFVPAGTLYMG